MTSQAVTSLSDLVSRIEQADVYDVAAQTPLDPAPRLSERFGNTIWLKREDLQPGFSFKCRGAQNCISKLPPDVASRGVICSSAGNHAQGVARAAARRGIRAVVVMPENTAAIKVHAVERLGAEIILFGDSYDGAYSKALSIADQQSLFFVHPFADPDVIAGQGTIARELEAAWPERPAAVFVPVGGGGLISGVGAYLKERHPDVRIVGVEPVDAASMHAALAAGHPVELDRVGTFADGVAVRQVASETCQIAGQVVDEMVLVDTDEICAAIRDIFEDCRVVTEPAGALAVAGLKRFVEGTGISGKSLVAIASGANMDFTRLRHVAERAEIGEHREALLAVSIPEQPGAFLEFCRHLGQRNITEFNYRVASTNVAHIFVGVSLTDSSETTSIIDSLEARGYGVTDLSRNELAKLHVRHMIGGYRPDIENERLFRFEFPERPGALLDFLKAVGVEWNISLFHYRNHGSDYGRVLAGVQVPPADETEFRAHIDTLGYPYWAEGDNPAYRFFLGGNRAES